MIEPQNITQEREEIKVRVANFKATQQRFERERDEFFVRTLGNVWLPENRHQATRRPPFWS